MKSLTFFSAGLLVVNEISLLINLEVGRNVDPETENCGMGSTGGSGSGEWFSFLQDSIKSKSRADSRLYFIRNKLGAMIVKIHGLSCPIFSRGFAILKPIEHMLPG